MINLPRDGFVVDVEVDEEHLVDGGVTYVQRRYPEPVQHFPSSGEWE